ncbi:glutamine--tRNA ligase/YqeY domain fusion protein [Arcicella sp. LKC2W]|uniref:glutamine--tRNA ligase/YqeY domain fusion protein n=1 Tax=Arcicella sp. LKC2W TaxID=2984198 RepID=UPI002B1F402F|nr:glutamine--tRNA ligase/YqeY domain fusion protein [Arcicella sp. LKC2W]MEA5461245.1 glutamine--tRNA ligase/YqeY domain fusion protein [Arcicella sp. LKC2W]
MEEEKKSLNFLEQIVEEDLASGKHEGRVLTRFPPEPNGYLHIGHAKSICLNFGLAAKYGGQTNLRFDDTNPEKEETEYVESIKADVKWLGFEWTNNQELYASDYFETLYQFAVELIKKGLAYVDDQPADMIAAQKGNPNFAGEDSPYRYRPIAENIDLFARMRAGEFPDGAKVLRAKIDMAHPNMHMRDPLMYRIKHAHHHRTGDAWCIYPMYDFAHGQSDSHEEITHSICTLEFDVHRPLYDWFIEKLNIFPSQQYEFARLNLTNTVMSKRRLLQLVQEGLVSGWDDPRMPTISGLRRRGFTPASVRNFCEKIGVGKRENLIDVSVLDFCVREDLNKSATRVMAVLDPLKVIITNYPEGQSEEVSIENNPENIEAGSRLVPFSREIYIERDDFMEEPMKKFFRLGPGLMVRLKGAYIIKCDDFVKDEFGNITELHCSYIENSRSGGDASGVSVKGVIHWVSVPHAHKAEVRLYDRLLILEDASQVGDDFKKFLNPDSLTVLSEVFIEPSLKDAKIGTNYQFMRKGYFCLDTDSTPENLVFNRTVGLKDSFKK